MEIKRYEPGPRMSRIIEHNGTVYFCHVADDPSGDVQDQVRQVLRRIEASLTMAGSEKSKILTAQIFLSEIRDFAAMNEIWDAWVDKANPPVRATFEAKLGRPELKVEIFVTAAK